jgi:hypothetical protein
MKKQGTQSHGFFVAVEKALVEDPDAAIGMLRTSVSVFGARDEVRGTLRQSSYCEWSVWGTNSTFTETRGTSLG